MSNAPDMEGKVYLRYAAKTKTFDFKLEVNGKPVPMGDREELTGLTQEQLGNIRAGMLAAPNGGQAMAELLDWLIEEAKKDTEGRYVSASSAEVAAGQATVSGK